MRPAGPETSSLGLLSLSAPFLSFSVRTWDNNYFTSLLGGVNEATSRKTLHGVWQIVSANKCHLLPCFPI